jgi:hypothetical protein
LLPAAVVEEVQLSMHTLAQEVALVAYFKAMQVLLLAHHTL